MPYSELASSADMTSSKQEERARKVNGLDFQLTWLMQTLNATYTEFSCHKDWHISSQSENCYWRDPVKGKIKRRQLVAIDKQWNIHVHNLSGMIQRWNN